MKNKTSKYVAVIGLALLVALIMLQFSAMSMAEGLVEKKLPKYIKLNYDQLSVNIVFGQIRLNNVSLKIGNRTNSDNYGKLQAKQMNISGINFWNLYFGKTVEISELKLNSPEFEYQPSKRVALKNKSNQGVVNLLRSININNTKIENGSLTINGKKDSTLFKLSGIHFEMEGVMTDAKRITDAIPFEYDNFSLHAQNLFADLGTFEQMTIDSISVSDSSAIFTNVSLNSKYDKVELTKVLARERDHITLDVPMVELLSFDFGFSNNRFYFDSEMAGVDRPDLKLYREKGLADEISDKALYGEILRKLPFDISLNQIRIVNGKIRYAENTRSDTKAGSIFFDEVDMTMTNFGNVNDKSQKTTVNVDAKMMGAAPLNLEYEFDFNESNNAFTVKGSLVDLDSKKVNSFLEPNVGVTTSGIIDELYFTVEGNENQALGDLKMKYSDFSFKVLKKDRLGVNKVLTYIGNLFIDDGRNMDLDGYRHGSITAERNKQKSFFNYLWIMVEDGILSALVGKSKKVKT